MRPPFKILCVEPIAETQELLRAILTVEGYDVKLARTAEEAMRGFRAQSPVLVIVDVDLPGPTNGLELCRNLRTQSNVPIIVLAAHEGHFVEALEEAGADAYAVKPVKAKHLLARVHALLRRLYPKDEVLNIGALRLDVASRRFYINKQEVGLTVQEFALLEAFMQHPGRALSRAELLNVVWHNSNVIDRVIDVNISNLRRKAPSAGKHIVAVRSVGYRFDV